jgi:hypothetical protein
MFGWFARGPLFAPEADNGAGGGEANGGGSGNNPVSADEKRITELINSAINGYAKRQEKELKTQLQRLEEAIAKMDTGSGDQGNGTGGGGGENNGGGNGAGADGISNDKLDPHVKARLDKLERDNRRALDQLENEKKAREEANQRALETERISAIRTELQKYQIRPENIEDMFDLFRGKVARDNDGNFVVGDTTMEAAVRTTMERMAGVMLPERKSGSGTTPGSRNSRVDLNDMHAGASPEQKAAYRAELLKFIPKGM